MKYIVLWSLLVHVSDPCPDSNPFGINDGITSCLAYHGHTERQQRSKVFTNRAEAFQFYNRGLDTYGIDSLKIDSIYAK